MHSQDLVIIMHALVMRSDSHWKAIIIVLLAQPYSMCGYFVFANAVNVLCSLYLISMQ